MAMAQHAEARFAGTTADTTVDGSAIFDVTNGKVTMKLDITVPKRAGKTVAVHFHQHGDCGNKGEMAHGHWNPTNKDHGKWGSSSFHSGDIGNIALDKDGKGTFSVETDLWTLGGDTTTNILGKSIIVHSGVDDYKTQPTGNSGSRIGCAVINKQ
ncbi:MAG: superoxide dismutase family protein [Chitinophagaceae bacterium]|nr:superoxide dismutase family protein [Chitinophagaceae bacterium]